MIEFSAFFLCPAKSNARADMPSSAPRFLIHAIKDLHHLLPDYEVGSLFGSKRVALEMWYNGIHQRANIAHGKGYGGVLVLLFWGASMRMKSSAAQERLNLLQDRQFISSQTEREESTPVTVGLHGEAAFAIYEPAKPMTKGVSVDASGERRDGRCFCLSRPFRVTKPGAVTDLAVGLKAIVSTRASRKLLGRFRLLATWTRLLGDNRSRATAQASTVCGLVVAQEIALDMPFRPAITAAEPIMALLAAEVQSSPQTEALSSEVDETGGRLAAAAACGQTAAQGIAYDRFFRPAVATAHPKMVPAWSPDDVQSGPRTEALSGEVDEVARMICSHDVPRLRCGQGRRLVDARRRPVHSTRIFQRANVSRATPRQKI